MIRIGRDRVGVPMVEADGSTAHGHVRFQVSGDFLDGIVCLHSSSKVFATSKTFRDLGRALIDLADQDGRGPDGAFREPEPGGPYED